ncbi:MAG: DUF4115 domain-containing protein [Nitrospiraceae bacterium]|nr:DUF4115 domain-containing protein [Nitrospiraceae bacterium]
MDLAGEILKQRREALGRDIQEIADLLKIRADCIRAIEEDAFEKLPAPVYTIGYIRCYAKYLGIDADPIVEHYSKNLSPPRSSTIIPVASFQRKNPKIVYAVIALLVIVGAFSLADYIRKRPADRAAVVPAKPQAVEAAPVRAAEGPEAPNSLPRTHNHGAPAAGVAPEVGAAPVAPEAVPEKQASAETHGLEISATEKSWIRLRFRNGKSEDVLLAPGESRTWSFSGGLALRIGNAGGVQLNLDGRSLGRPGNRGEVVTMALPPQ